jgi:TM2 domain-containing membrane protein YozV
MNTAEEREHYQDEDRAPMENEAEAQRKVSPTYPAEVRRRKGFPYKSPLLASLLSCFPGLGQIYIGYYQRGFTHAIIVATTITALASGIGGLTPMFGVLLAFFWIYNIIDAGRRASLYNQAVDGIEGIEMPQEIKLGGGGSVAGGVLLIAIGLVLFLHTRFDVSMAWVEEWWPLGAVILGVYLIYKARTNGKRDES